MYTIADMLVLVSPVVTFTKFSVVITLSAKRLPDPASVVIGLLTVWKLAVVRILGIIWNCTNSIFWWSVKELRTPDLIMAEKAPSVGAKMVTPSLESLSWENNWMSSWVDFIRRVKNAKWPAFWRILMTLTGPFETCTGTITGGEAWADVAAGGGAVAAAGAFAGAAFGGWDSVWVQWRKRRTRKWEGN